MSRRELNKRAFGLNSAPYYGTDPRATTLTAKQLEDVSRNAVSVAKATPGFAKAVFIDPIPGMYHGAKATRESISKGDWNGAAIHGAETALDTISTIGNVGVVASAGTGLPLKILAVEGARAALMPILKRKGVAMALSGAKALSKSKPITYGPKMIVGATAGQVVPAALSSPALNPVPQPHDIGWREIPNATIIKGVNSDNFKNPDMHGNGTFDVGLSRFEEPATDWLPRPLLAKATLDLGYGDPRFGMGEGEIGQLAPTDGGALAPGGFLAAGTKPLENPIRILRDKMDLDERLSALDSLKNPAAPASNFPSLKSLALVGGGAALATGGVLLAANAWKKRKKQKQLEEQQRLAQQQQQPA